MCLNNPNCWLWPGHRIKKKATRPPRSRQSTRAYRTKLQGALLQSSITNTLLKRVNDVVPRQLLTLDASEKLSNHPDLIRDILARSLVHDHHAGKPQDQFIWQALLSILESELPKNNAPEPIWSAQEIDFIQRPDQLLPGQEKVILHPIWRRFTDVASTRKLIADAAVSQAVAKKSAKVVEVFWNHQADLSYAPEGKGYSSALDQPYFEAPSIDWLRRFWKIRTKVPPGATLGVALGL
ncbi:hypothetical protein QBC36DRAFT_334234 [Triangularia setosa]|uniref:Uncharacterized protein n=1 Tax=Triangularia setosa TaxID=2587417 RepID=A0AAN6W365_9PEZI|nr:hypothetical protein QBC36DRAFT_334234 [Podospora setosa]